MTATRHTDVQTFRTLCDNCRRWPWFVVISARLAECSYCCHEIRGPLGYWVNLRENH